MQQPCSLAVGSEVQSIKLALYNRTCYTENISNPK